MGNQAYGSLANSWMGLLPRSGFLNNVHSLIYDFKIDFLGDSEPGFTGQFKTVISPFKGFTGFVQPEDNGSEAGMGDSFDLSQSVQSEYFDSHFHAPHSSKKMLDLATIWSHNSSCESDKLNAAEQQLHGILRTHLPELKPLRSTTDMLSQHAHAGVFPCKVSSPNHANNNILSLFDSGSTSNPAVVNASLYFGDEWCDECAGQGGSEYAIESWDGAFLSETVCGGCNGTGLSLLGRISEGLEQAPVWPFPLMEGGLA